MPRPNQNLVVMPRRPFLDAEPFAPPGWPVDVAPNQVITSTHMNQVRTSVYSWPGDVLANNHKLEEASLISIAPAAGADAFIVKQPATGLWNWVINANGHLETRNSRGIIANNVILTPVAGANPLVVYSPTSQPDWVINSFGHLASGTRRQVQAGTVILQPPTGDAAFMVSNQSSQTDWAIDTYGTFISNTRREIFGVGALTFKPPFDANVTLKGINGSWPVIDGALDVSPRLIVHSKPGYGDVFSILNEGVGNSFSVSNDGNLVMFGSLSMRGAAHFAISWGDISLNGGGNGIGFMQNFGDPWKVRISASLVTGSERLEVDPRLMIHSRPGQGDVFWIWNEGVGNSFAVTNEGNVTTYGAMTMRGAAHFNLFFGDMNLVSGGGVGWMQNMGDPYKVRISADITPGVESAIVYPMLTVSSNTGIDGLIIKNRATGLATATIQGDGTLFANILGTSLPGTKNFTAAMFNAGVRLVTGKTITWSATASIWDAADLMVARRVVGTTGVLGVTGVGGIPADIYVKGVACENTSSVIRSALNNTGVRIAFDGNVSFSATENAIAGETLIVRTGVGALQINGPASALGDLKVRVLDATTHSASGVPGAAGSFTSADGKTVTVSAGIITNIV